MNSSLHYLTLSTGTDNTYAYVLSDEAVKVTLHSSSLEEVKELRKSYSPFLVFKENDKYYAADVPADLNFVIKGETHCCGHNCKRLSALPDDKGGCAKVRNRKVNRIEDYPWITHGYETVNTKHDVFVVMMCTQYKEAPERVRPSAEELQATKVGLAQYIWGDIDNYSQLKYRTKHLDASYYARMTDILK